MGWCFVCRKPSPDHEKRCALAGKKIVGEDFIDAVKVLLDTMPQCEEGYYSHWDAGCEDTDKAVRKLRRLLKTL